MNQNRHRRARKGRKAIRQKGGKPRARSAFSSPSEEERTIGRLVLTIGAVAVAVLVTSYEPGLDRSVLTDSTWLGRVAGVAIAYFVITAITAAYLLRFEPHVVASRTRIAVVCTLCLVMILLAKSSRLLGFCPYLIPVSLISIVMAIVCGQATALLLSALLTFLVAFVLMASPILPSITKELPFLASLAKAHRPTSLETLLVLSGGALVSVFGAARIRDRSRLLEIGILVAFVHAVLAFSTALMRNQPLTDASWGVLLCTANGLGVGIILTLALPFLEYAFNMTTDMRLLELSSQNQPIIKRMVLDAPGTYHHSQILGSLADAGAEAIAANSLLARVAAYFHDIGKMEKPYYYFENQGDRGNIHDRLSARLSALVIMSHTRDGVELGHRHNLPQPILDIIQQHHGTTLMEYFYREAVQKNGDNGKPSEDFFRYPGPKPQTKEAAIVLLADSVEAASRTLSEPTPARIERLVHDIVLRKLVDGQLDESRLTLTDLSAVQASFVKVLTGIFHGRIKYPVNRKAEELAKRK